MEKFSNWRDKGTGISPFLPAPVPAVNPVTRFVVNPLVVLVKLPILTIVLLLSLIFPFKAWYQFITKYLFFFPELNVSVQGFRRGDAKALQQYSPKPNQLFFANFISPLDPIFLLLISKVSSWKNVSFLIPSTSNEIYLCSMFDAVFFTFQSPNSKPARFQAIIKDINAYVNANPSKVCFYFIEGTTSNNRAVLPLIYPPITTTTNSINSRTIMLKLSPQYLTLPIPVVSKFAYLYRLLSLRSEQSLAVFRIVINEGVSIKESVVSALLNNSYPLLHNETMSLKSKEAFYKYYIDHKVKAE